MNAGAPTSVIEHKPRRLLTFASGGWVLVLTAVLSLALIAIALAPAIWRTVNRPPGDGENIHSYAFDLSNLTVPESQILPALRHRDMAPTLDHPAAHGANVMQKVNDPKRGKYIVPSDLIIGVEVNGETRAYPLHVMYVHEIINDTLAGVPIAVTHHWPSGCTMVFDRRLEDRPIEFGVSGLVYNSNLLMYARKPVVPGAASEMGGESLWSQMLRTAISGEAARSSQQLQALPYEISRWDDWLARHPETTVVQRDTKLLAWYKGAAPTTYLRSDDLLHQRAFVVDPPPPADGPAPKTPVFAVFWGEHRRVYSVPALLEKARSTGSWSDELAGITLRFVVNQESKTVRVEANSSGDDVHAIHAYWFAWHAMHPDDQLTQ